MQQIGSIARTVLADIKRAKEARDGKLAGGLLGPAEFTNQELSPPDGPRRASKVGVTAQGAGQLTAADAWEDGGGLEKGGERAAYVSRESTASSCARPDAPGSAAGSTDRADTRPGGLD